MKQNTGSSKTMWYILGAAVLLLLMTNAEFLSNMLDPALSWLLDVPLWLGILILSLVITLIINVVYKYTTDQEEMHRLKKKIKHFQTEMKKHKSDSSKVMKLQSEAMQVNMKLMKNSFKSTIYTIAPIIIIFSWMNANLAFGILEANEEVEVLAKLSEPARITLEAEIAIVGEPTKETIESQAKWTVSGDPGVHELRFVTEEGDVATHDVYIGQAPRDNLQGHEQPFKTTQIMYNKATPFGGFSMFGYQPGWLFTYILFSIVFSLVTRKLMNLA